MRAAATDPDHRKAIMADWAEAMYSGRGIVVFKNAFPTNLDRDPPIGGLAPQTQQQLMAKALAENWEPDAFNPALKKHSWRRLT